MSCSVTDPVDSSGITIIADTSVDNNAANDRCLD